MHSFLILFYIFASQHLLNEVNYRIYRTKTNAFGVVFLYSFYFVKGGCCNSEEATLSIFNYFKFFTNATPSRKFGAKEQQYFATNGISPIRRNYQYLPSTKLHFRRIYKYVRANTAPLFQNFNPWRKHQYCFWDYQKGNLFWACNHLLRGIPKIGFRYATHHINFIF